MHAGDNTMQKKYHILAHGKVCTCKELDDTKNENKTYWPVERPVPTQENRT
jgi:hypothetical protein